ncbi:hypothetical protein WA026_005830 [Henosepilachna vigintioctopunctata]|uniref:Thiamin pyrophosphokinase thiamin-binding domain-containing protein n=1 Tax=Henosepilachna vigintioctopunctata TaxID=420089 RepID=A0AAW1TXL4_9CUCU
MPDPEVNISNIKAFNPCENIFSKLYESKNYGVLILNSPTKLVNGNLWKLWNHARIRVLVDGGSASWISRSKTSSESDPRLLHPHLVTGDFDSILPDALEKFKQSDVIEVIHTPDQNETDFTKALLELDNYRKKKNIKIENIYVITEMVEGRVDQIMANFNTLYKSLERLPDISVYLLSSDSISWLLSPGTYSISIPQLLRDNHEWCGLIPLGCAATISTSGLKWNLDKHKSYFGILVSTSNTYDGSPEVTVETDSNLLWTMSTSGLECPPENA